MNGHDQEICRLAVETFGHEKQIDMCIEECGELIVALQHYKRGRATKEQVAEEVADVAIMVEQMRTVFWPHVYLEDVSKMQRLEGILSRGSGGTV